MTQQSPNIFISIKISQIGAIFFHNNKNGKKVKKIIINGR